MLKLVEPHHKKICLFCCLHICENINCAVSARLISGVCSFKNKTIQILLFKIGNFKPRSTFCTDWFVYYTAENVGLLFFLFFFSRRPKIINSGLKTVVIKKQQKGTLTVFKNINCILKLLITFNIKMRIPVMPYCKSYYMY